MDGVVPIPDDPEVPENVGGLARMRSSVDLTMVETQPFPPASPDPFEPAALPEHAVPPTQPSPEPENEDDIESDNDIPESDKIYTAEDKALPFIPVNSEKTSRSHVQPEDSVEQLQEKLDALVKQRANLTLSGI